MIDYILYDHNKHELELFKKFAKDLNLILVYDQVTLSPKRRRLH